MLTLHSIRYYRSYYRLFAVAVIIMMSVVVGSLLLGDSVRGTLRDRVYERLGQTQTLIASGTGFLDASVMEDSLLQDAQGYLMLQGFVSSGDRMIPVQVFGTEDDSTYVNSPLYDELHGASDVVLHLPAHNMVPSGSLFVTQSYSTQLRLSIQGVRTREQGGNLLLRNEQILPLNIFVPRQTLGEVMELPSRINLILSPRLITEEQWSRIWTPQLSGIHLSGNRLTSDRIFLPAPLVDAIHPVRRSMAYLVNEIMLNQDTVPYSFVTATSCWEGRPLQGDDIILSEDAAQRLGCAPGDTVSMGYFVSQDLKSLQTESRTFVVRDIVPRALLQDSMLMADFPGLSHVERCTDWDSDLPIQMDHIHRADEDDWYEWHQTPKALVAYDTMKPSWGSTYGVATSLEVEDSAVSIRSLSYSDLGMTLVHPVQSALKAAVEGTDFASLFMALGFFIILSGILLMLNPLWEMLSIRQPEWEVLTSLGFSRRHIRRLLWRECSCVLLLASPLGVLAGWIYSGLTLYLLGNVWSGATHTQGFALHVSSSTLLMGWLSCLLLSFLITGLAIHRVAEGRKPSTVLPAPADHRSSRGTVWAVLCTLLFLGILAYAIVSPTSIMLFIICGLLWLVATALWGWRYVRRQSLSGSFSRSRWTWQMIHAARSQNLLSFWSLSTGVFIVFAVGLSRPSFTGAAEDAALTGRYQLWAECQIPLQYDLNIPQVRRKLHLQDLDTAEVRFMQFMRHTMDEASCLNLNRVSTPTVLGVDAQQFSSRFDIQLPTDFSQLSTDPLTNARVGHILIDSESLIWSLMRQVGDTLRYESAGGDPILLVIAATYPTGIFHGQAIMDRTVFRSLWPEEGGTSLFLVQTPEGQERPIRELLQIALSAYGIDIVTTIQRIELFFSVTDTYLSIFLTLGALGLLLGIFCLVIGVRKSLVTRRGQIQQLSYTGFSSRQIQQSLYREHIIVPLYAIACGTSGALISISANVAGAGLWTILTALLAFLLLLLLTLLAIRMITQGATDRQLSQESYTDNETNQKI